MTNVPGITPNELAEVIERIKDVPGLVLVGGQAVHFWHETFAPRVPALANLAVTSQDVDFQGSKVAAKLCGKKLNATAVHIAKDFDPTPNTGKVIYTNQQGIKREIDFLSQPHGLESDEVRKYAVTVTMNNGAEDFTVTVMSPLDSLISRVHNVVDLRRTSDHSLNQLRSALLVARASIEMALGADVKALKLNEVVFSLAASPRGLAIFQRHQVDIFDAVVADHPSLPDSFVTKRYPQMQGELAKLRSKKKKR